MTFRNDPETDEIVVEDEGREVVRIPVGVERGVSIDGLWQYVMNKGNGSMVVS